MSGLFKSLKSMSRNTDAVLSIDSSGVRKPSANMPEMNPLNATPGMVYMASAKESVKMIFSVARNTTLSKLSKSEANTMSMRRSILRTIRVAASDEASTNRNGTIWKLAAFSTPNETSIAKNTELNCPNRIAIRNEQNDAGMMHGSAYGEEKRAALLPNTVTAYTMRKNTAWSTTSLNSGLRPRHTGLSKKNHSALNSMR